MQLIYFGNIFQSAFQKMSTATPLKLGHLTGESWRQNALILSSRDQDILSFEEA